MLSADKHIRRLERMLQWPRPKKHRFWNKCDIRALWKLTEYGTGQEMPYAEQVERKKLQIQINNFDRTGD